MAGNGYLYVFREPNHSWWKIGISADPDRRFNDLKAARPDNLELVEYYELRSMKIARRAERLLHETFRESRLMGEWFSKIDLETVRNIVGPEDSYRAYDEIHRTFFIRGRCLTENEILWYTADGGGVPEKTVFWALRWMLFRREAYLAGLNANNHEVYSLKH